VSLSALSIKRPVLAWMLMFALIIFGGIAFMRMGVSQLPDVDFPMVAVSVNYEGAAPAVIESDVIDPIESAIMSVQGVRSVSSSARQSSGSIKVEFDLDRDIDAALQEVQNKITQVQRQLPREMDPPVITKTNPEDQPIMWLAISSQKHPAKDLMPFVRDRIKDQFTTVPGVGDITLGGFIEPNLRVWLSKEKLDRYAFSVSDVLNTIRSEHSELPAGRIETETKEFNVRTMGEAQSTKEFGDLVINQRGGAPNYAPIRLKELAEVEEGLDDVRRISRVADVAEGKPAESSVGLGIRKQRGSNAVEVAHAVKKKMELVSKTLPEGMSLRLVFDSTRFIEEAIGELNFTLILSAILTAMVCWLFLGSWSSTINVVLAIPTSIVGTFIVLYFAGFTLNTFTLLGLSLAIGIVVDDAIMVLENIVRHAEHGKSRREAALFGAEEITFAAMAATVAILAIFLPVAFMEGAIGRFFFQFGVTMSVAVALSLLEALTLTPMRCAEFLDVRPRTSRIGRGIENGLEQLRKYYTKILSAALKRPVTVFVSALGIFVITVLPVGLIKKEFVPAQDESRFIVRIQTPVGSSIQFTDNVMREIEKTVAKIPEVERYFLAVGGFGGGEVNAGNMFVTLKDLKKRKRSQAEIMDECRKSFAKIQGLTRATLQDMSMRGFSASRGFPIEFTVQGPDWDKLADYAHEIMKQMEATGLMSDVDTDYRTGMPEVQIYPDRIKAARHGVSVATIGETVNALVGGVIAGRYPKGGHRYDIRVRLVAGQRNSAEDLKTLFVRNNRGELIPLSEVVRIEEKPTLQIIARQDRERAVSVFANVRTGKSQTEALAAVDKISKKILPFGYRAVIGGSSQTFKESGQSLIFALLVGILVSYMVLASQFNSFVDPITVLMALPFSVSGAILALWMTGLSLNIYSMIGLILLMGIVKKNSILLVEFTNQVRDHNQKDGKNADVRAALLEACPVRLRPILMTSIATIAGAIPPALAIGPGAESRIPMAVAVIGGVLVSTLLTLLVVPCAYVIFENLGVYIRSKRKLKPA